MAGGGGTRLWPLSTSRKPKQFLNLSGKETLVNEAIDRLSGVAQETFIVTNASQAQEMLSQTAGRVPEDHILREPAARNTAACIGYAAMTILKKYGDGIMCVVPSDPYIRDEEGFRQTLKSAVAAAEETDALVTIGIRPTFPSTGYGYIKNAAVEGKPWHRVEEFVEKPDEETAERYVAEGYAWNSGMFIWKASLILQKLEKYLPELYKELLRIGEAVGTEREEAVIDSVYPEMPSISVDYGVLEKSDGIYVVPADLGWSDVGSLDMLGAVRRADENDNVTVGETYPVDTHHTIIYTGGKPVCTVGVDDLIIVDTPDVLLVCSKERAQDVKKIVEELRAKGKEELL